MAKNSNNTVIDTADFPQAAAAAVADHSSANRNGGLKEPRGVVVPMKNPLEVDPAMLKSLPPATRRLFEIVDDVNLADDLDESTLNKIGEECTRNYELDERSLSDWRRAMEEGLELARLIGKKRNWPWPKASNAIYPLIAQTAIQFGSRTMPTLIKGDEVVKGKKYGGDPQGAKAGRSARIAEHMNYQLLEQMEDWYDDQDLMTVALPVTGVIFKKSFYDALLGRNVSETIFPDRVIVNAKVRRLSKARRISHVLDPYTENDVYERKEAGYWLEKADLGGGDDIEGYQTTEDTDKLFQLVEQHCFFDLDKDGYKEPYIVTFHPASGKVVRIKARWKIDGIVVSPTGKLVKIIPREYFTAYQFMPAFDGSVYGLGFGILLGQPNKILNSMIRQLIDQGTLHITGAGLISGDIGIQGSHRFAPAEYKVIEGQIEDIGKKIYRLPTTEPPMAVFRVLELLIGAFERLGGQADVLSGESQGANQPAAGTLALIEQGLKVYNAILKRIMRAQRQEMKKLMRLNMEHLPEIDYFTVLDTEKAIARADYFEKDADVVLVGAAEDTTKTEKLLKAQILMEQIDHVEPPIQELIRRRLYEALDIPDFEELFLPDDYKAEPTPELKLKLFDLDLKKMELDIKKMEVETKQMDVDVKKAEINLQKQELDLERDKFQAEENHRKIESGIKLSEAEERRREAQRAAADEKVGKSGDYKVGAR